ncbi:MAG: alpha/beta fold hydrolase [Acetobacteraceae bacterium]|nr:alpha/beta fold hydrolase [Acetobacteraceae bacterium]
MTEMGPLESGVLDRGLRSGFVRDINGLRMHVLEAGFEGRDRPLILLLHGFPELAYSWRKVLPLAAAGYRVVAPDQRGYGRSTGWDADYDGDLGAYRILNLVRDVLWLVFALGYREAATVAGHDFAASVAGSCALVRPDVFRSVALMSPFSGAPGLPFDTATNPPQPKPPEPDIQDELASAKLDRPRKHYQWYYSSRQANADMWHCPQGVHAFLRGYFHYKSADWAEPAISAEILDCGRAGQNAELLHYGSRQEHGRDCRRRNAVRRGNRRLSLADRGRACGLQQRIRAHRLSGRAAVVSRPDSRS